MANEYKIAALEKGLRVLACFSPNQRSLGVSEVSRIAGIPVSTCFRILRTLADADFVRQLDDGTFAPSAAVLKLGFAALQGNEIVESTRLPLRELQRKTRETCSLTVLSGADIVYLLRYKSDRYIIGNVVAGSILPAACTAMGKTLLATLEEPSLEEVLSKIELDSPRMGPNAAKSLEELREDLETTRERGWGFQDEEVAHGLRSIAVPIINIDGPAGALGVSVEAAQWSEEEMVNKLLPPLTEAANKASVNMGYLPSVKSFQQMKN